MIPVQIAGSDKWSKISIDALNVSTSPKDYDYWFESAEDSADYGVSFMSEDADSPNLETLKLIL